MSLWSYIGQKTMKLHINNGTFYTEKSNVYKLLPDKNRMILLYLFPSEILYLKGRFKKQDNGKKALI